MESIFIKTHGCATNHSESELMAGILNSYGYNITNNIEDAEVIIINICTVKGNQTALKEVKSAIEKHSYKKLVIAGCISKEIIPQIRELTEDAVLISTNNLFDIKDAVEEALNNNPAEFLDIKDDLKINKKKLRNNPIIGIIPISSGCNQNCAYCSVILIKGKLKSYDESAILKELKSCVNDGCKEIWITSQDTASYQTEKENLSKLPDLLNKISRQPGDFIARVGMMNPNLVKPVLKDLIDALKSEKIYKFLHLPVQSGNNEILKSMGRKYTVEDFKEIVNEFRKEIPQITISTDIITGFPGETDQQFEDSVNLIKEIKPDVLNISRFIPRPYTKAYSMKDQIHGNISKERSRKITKLFEWQSFEKNKSWKNWEGPILITEKGKPGTNTSIGRNLCYKPIVLQGDLKPGQKLKVKITDVTNNYLVGKQV